MPTGLQSRFKFVTSFLLLLIAFSARTQPGPLLDSVLANQTRDTFSTVSQASSQGSCNRAAIITDYVTNYLGSSVSTAELGWTGSVTGCVSGSISAQTQTKTIQRINYFRRLVGLSGTVTFDPSHNAATQDAALMMLANGALNHLPPPTWKCYTDAGMIAAGKSNLASGYQSSGAVTGFMFDFGDANKSAGHRAWILDPGQVSFGHGATSYTDVLWVSNNKVIPTSLPAFVAYPPAGYVPRDLVPERWSFSIPQANVNSQSSTVVVTGQTGTPLSLTLNPASGKTLTWDIKAKTDLVWDSILDKAYTVRVTGVKIGGVTQPDYVYRVVAIDPSAPSLTLTAINPSCGGASTNGSIMATFDRGGKSYRWSNGATTPTVSNLGAGTYTVTVTDQNDCTYSKSVTLSNTTANVPQLTASLTGTSCPGTPVSLTASGCQGTTTWSNGLGSGTSKSVVPAVTTTFSATCAENACISSFSSITVPVAPGPTPACTVSATSGLSPYYGLLRFTFNTIDTQALMLGMSTSKSDGANYVNRACDYSTTVTAGTSYSVLVMGSASNTHQFRVYIDYNNSGAFTDPGELVLTGVGSSLTATVAISSSAATNVPLRMRVVADGSSNCTSCLLPGAGSYGSGQAEDFSLVILPGCSSMITTKAGNWIDPTVWSCNRIPTATDVVQINHVVTLPVSLQALARKLTFGSGGRLMLNTATQLKLTP